MAGAVQPLTSRDAFAVTKSDTTISPFDALWVGGAGNVAVRTQAGNVVTFVGAVAGSIIPQAGDRVMSTNTTATSIVGLIY